MSYYRAVAQAAAATSTVDRIGVLVVNLGTADAPSYLAVQRYLREFLSDRRVIDRAPLLWLPLLYGVILPLRPLRTARNYLRIWTADGSPLAVYSRRLAHKIGAALQASCGDSLRVELGMTYGKPSIESAIQRLAEQGVRRLLVLPLYPQYCSATTGSVYDRVGDVLKRWRWLPALRIINDYYRDPGYVDAWATRIARLWQQRGERSHLVLAYHGIPETYVRDGDPYQRQAQETTRLISGRLNLSPDEFSHCYQSRFGPVAWLQPYTRDALLGLAKRGIRKLTVVSPSFAVDCLETLEEVAIEYRDQFLQLGGERFDFVNCLNDDDEHAQFLAALIRRNLAGWA
ncbi:MAG: ferrochelatase [Steroidobacterales bacterium]